MFCIYCKKEQPGRYCGLCGHENVNSQNEWSNWNSRLKDYSKEELENMLANKEEYQSDAILVATYLRDAYQENAKLDVEQVQVEDDIVWYYSEGGKRKGPVSKEKIIQMYQSGYMRETSAIWKYGFKDWVRLDETGIITPDLLSKTPPPVNVKNMNNRAIIILFFVPIISTLIQHLIAGIFDVEPFKLWWVAYCLNVLCCSIDYLRVRKAGYNADKMLAGFLFLIPLYIYQRMKLVNGKKWLATSIWIIIFVIDLLIPNIFWVKTIGISNPSVITSVKEGSFNSYSNVTIDRFFNNAVDRCIWTTYVGPSRRVFVRMGGNIEGESIVVIFEMHMDNSFDVSSMTFAGSQCTNSQISALLEYIYVTYN